jgi:hypothetical protein
MQHLMRWHVEGPSNSRGGKALLDFGTQYALIRTLNTLWFLTPMIGQFDLTRRLFVIHAFLQCFFLSWPILARHWSSICSRSLAGVSPGFLQLDVLASH